MKKEIIIRISVKSDKCQKKAMKVAATVTGNHQINYAIMLNFISNTKIVSFVSMVFNYSWLIRGRAGVQSVTLAGGEKNLLLVIGEGVDTSKLTKNIKKKVGLAEIVELRTVDSFEAAAAALPGGFIPATKEAAARAMAAARSSPYLHHHQPPSPSHHHQQWQYHHPYAFQFHPSPMMAAAHGGYGGSSYSRAVALSHPANYSPLVEKHDYHPMNHSSSKKKTTTTGTTTTTTTTGAGAGNGNGNGNVASLKAVPRSRRHGSGRNFCCIL
uniref:HMA domain-containing protein n=1 Tax=Oryza brachyantha TaxID=4533 RepID=J3LE93_ORYBR